MTTTALSLARWHQIETLFAQALDQPPAARAAFLASACQGDEALRARLGGLLDAHTRSEGFLDTLDPERIAALIVAVGPALEAGRRVGPYRVLRELGRGGMGIVYLAERADGQFEQQVALKLIKRGMDSEAILGRFLRERQILARLQHPNVARLLDGGVTDEGQPFFAMEYVEGLPITAYCDAHRLDLDARLRLFEKACEAVRYAHQNLVVHRDLKPSNILVTEQSGPDGGPSVKLLDFGVAKLLSEEDAPNPVTVTGGRLLTPAYAAPEQVRGEPVTTATDVYALGVVLCELLTGHRPYRLLRQAQDALAQTMDETQPTRPSVLVTRPLVVEHEDGTTEIRTPEALGAARRATPARLRRQLAGDLDTVLLKALRKEPARRYVSADAFLDDLRRHLAGLPVTARADTMGYRARRFVGRHRVGVAALLLVALSLVGGLGAALWQARRAEAERDLARREADRAEQVSAFLVNLFYLADPNYALGTTVTMPAALDSAALWLYRDLAGQPEARADLALKLSEIFDALGRYDQARQLADSTLALRRHLYGDESIEVAGTLTYLSELMRGQGQLAASEPVLREALAIQHRHQPGSDLDVAYTLTMLALALREQGRIEEAEPLAREALTISRAHAGEYPIGLHRSLTNLAHILRAQGHPVEAEALHREVLALRRAYWGDEHPEVANTLINLGSVLGDQERFAEAETFFREGLAMRRRLQGEGHPEVGVDLAGLAGLLHQKGDLAAAEATYREALAHQQQALGPDHPATVQTAQALDLVLRDEGKPPEVASPPHE